MLLANRPTGDLQWTWALFVSFVLVSCAVGTPTTQAVHVGPVNMSSPAHAETAAGTQSFGDDGSKVYLRSITALVFSANAVARSRRGFSRPQLSCVGGSAAGFFWRTNLYPRIVQCANIGWDGASIQWRCSAQLGKDLVFGDTFVVCEGYDFPGDEYILRGSCRLEYTLNFESFTFSWMHIIYGCVLSLGMLWVYYYSQIWTRSGFEKFPIQYGVGQPLARSGASPVANYHAVREIR